MPQGKTNVRLISLGDLHEHFLVASILVGMVDLAELAVLTLDLTSRGALLREGERKGG